MLRMPASNAVRHREARLPSGSVPRPRVWPDAPSRGPITDAVPRPGVSMTLEVRLFARIRELIGADTCTVDVPNGSAIAAVRSALANRYPGAKELITRSALAVNCEFAPDERVVDVGD